MAPVRGVWVPETRTFLAERRHSLSRGSLGTGGLAEGDQLDLLSVWFFRMLDKLVECISLIGRACSKVWVLAAMVGSKGLPTPPTPDDLRGNELDEYGSVAETNEFHHFQCTSRRSLHQLALARMAAGCSFASCGAGLAASACLAGGRGLGERTISCRGLTTAVFLCMALTGTMLERLGGLGDRSPANELGQSDQRPTGDKLLTQVHRLVAPFSFDVAARRHAYLRAELATGSFFQRLAVFRSFQIILLFASGVDLDW